MLTITKELDLNDFMNEYEDILPEDQEACEIIYDSLCDTMSEGVEDMTIRDYVRFQVYISTSKEFLSDFDIIDDEDIKDMDDDEINEAIESYLNDNTYLLGSYEDSDGEMIFIYDEF